MLTVLKVMILSDYDYLERLYGQPDLYRAKKEEAVG